MLRPIGSTLAHLVGVLSAFVLVGAQGLEFYKWQPLRNNWAGSMTGAIVALLGSLYASRRGSGWWYILTGLSIAIILILIIGLGG